MQWRLNNRAARVRQQAADLVSRIAVVMKKCGNDKLLGHLGLVLYEYLGEEYPEVLGSILGALKGKSGNCCASSGVVRLSNLKDVTWSCILVHFGPVCVRFVH